MNEPTTLRVGDTASWRAEFAAYPASAGWALYYRLLGEANQDAVQGSADGDGFLVTITAAKSVAYPAGVYTLVAWVEKAGERFTVSETTLVVKDNPASTGAGADTRSHSRKALALIEAAIESYAVRPVEELTIAGRTIRRPKLEQLVALRSRYQFYVKQELIREQAASGAEVGGSVLVKFNQVR